MRSIYCPLCGKKLALRTLGDEGDVPWCEDCSRPFFDSFSTCVIALVADELGEIAVLKENSRPYGGLVAGYVKPGENAEETARREILEELGLFVQALQLVRTYWFERGGQLMIGFFARVQKAPFALSREIMNAVWMRPEEAQKAMRPGGPAFQLVTQFMEEGSSKSASSHGQ